MNLVAGIDGWLVYEGAVTACSLRYCTSSVMVVDCWILPLVAVTVRVYVSGGGEEPWLWPPHPVRTAATGTQIRASDKSLNIWLILCLPLRTPPAANNGRNRRASVIGGSLLPMAGACCIAAVGVWMVRVTVCFPAFAAIVAGEKVAVAPGGSPLIEKVTGAA